ncbi:MAG: TolC family protein [Bdellovibrionales bacterium]
MGISLKMSLGVLGWLLTLRTEAATQKLTEKIVIDKLRNQSVVQKQEQAGSAQVQLTESLNQEKYQARAYTQYNFSRSSEKPLIVFNPVLSPSENWRAGVEKKVSYGVNLRAEVFGTQFTTQDQSFKNVTQTGTRVGAEVDLWKNLFGKFDRADLKSLQSQKERAKLQEELNLKKQEMEFRKVYWSLVALQQSIELSEGLVSSAEKQLADASDRQRVGVADKAEVARTKALLESRKSSLLLFEYEKEKLLQVFEKNFENFVSSDWALPVDEQRTALPLMQQCIDKIQSQKTVDSKSTSLSQILMLLKNETENEIKKAQLHAGPDLSLQAQYQTSGVSNSYEQARQDLDNRDRSGYALGVMLSIPLGDTQSKSEKTLLTAKKNALEAQIQYLENDIQSTHESMLKSLDLLNRGLKNQTDNAENMKISFSEIQKKYRQGRVPLTNLIFEQDSFFQSQLQVIEIQKQVALAVLDYFSVFNNFSCSWNRVNGDLK